MSAASTASGNRSRPPRGAMRLVAVMTSRPLWTALAVTALVTALRLFGTVDSDVAWQLWIARHVNAGANLYRDIVEINPPLWFWMALPVDRLATLFHLRSETALILAIGGLVALALAASDRLIRHIAPARRRLLLGYGALVLAAMPWMHVGQREQIVLIAAVPSAALIAARREGRPVPALLALLVGAGAGLGFALKHYFLIVPALLELWLLAFQRRQWSPWRPEIFAMAGVGALYACAILWLERDFLDRIVPLVRLAYGVTGAPAWRQLFGPGALVGLVTLGLVALNAPRLTAGKASFAGALAVAAVGFAAAYFIQAKGWPYHAIPLMGCASLALAALLAETEVPPAPLRVLAPAFLLLPFALSFEETRNPLFPTPDLRAAVSGLRPGENVGFLSTESAIPWSITLQHDLRYASRYLSYWMLIAVVANEERGNPDPRLAALGRTIVAETVADFRCIPPRRIIVARPRPGDDGFDILPFFLRDPQFAALMTHYREVSRTGVDVYDVQTPLPALPASACRRGV